MNPRGLKGRCCPMTTSMGAKKNWDLFQFPATHPLKKATFEIVNREQKITSIDSKTTLQQPCSLLHIEDWPTSLFRNQCHLKVAFALVPLGSEGDPGCIFFTHDTYQVTLISDILSYRCRNLGYFSDTDGGRTAEGQTDTEVKIVI